MYEICSLTSFRQSSTRLASATPTSRQECQFAGSSSGETQAAEPLTIHRNSAYSARNLRMIRLLALLCASTVGIPQYWPK